ncbi:hypothetical protein F5J12DRAFT_785455 [Pisolithus orientalis]|uniref:uncharacterized protein n=1 Tax=Pisolithus orientalis TaxID=936130 RepID=UPI0022241FAF|nr:uncharacterized protein F5J12DRAFT_785455 [Pisolithus orientalis]KAI5996503.1 hypothetical protein F5J12DRAFT_785455 [Pisolithus orientalis]
MSGRSIPVALSSFGSGRKHSGSSQADITKLKTPVPPYRHAAPSAPWPWMDFDVDESAVEPPYPGGLPSPPDHWKKYPQNLFGNWTPDQVQRSKMLTACSDSQPCLIYNVEVKDDGHFDKAAGERTTTVTADNAQEFWEELQQPRPEGIRIRAFFVDNLSLNVLKMLGTTFDIEPFFFSSSTNWIPSRYQEDAKTEYRDRCTRKPGTRPENVSSTRSATSQKLAPAMHGCSCNLAFLEVLEINTQAPLELTHEILLQDLLAIHMVRKRDSSTIISYHPISNLKKTSAKRLQSLVQRTGDSVYWSKLFAKSRDPTFVFLAILWYALYAWDETFDALYRHINKLESEVLRTNDINWTRELHKVQAYLLHYQQLLQDFHKSVDFVKNTPNPAMECDEDKDDSAKLLKGEANNLLSEISRLEGHRTAFATVNIEESRDMKRLTAASMRDSAAMKQISYLTMIFLPASLIASVFGMNIMEINPGTRETLSHYAEATVTLTVLTAWLVIAVQTESSFWPKGSPRWRRLVWPIYFVANLRHRLTDKQQPRSFNAMVTDPDLA